MYRCKCGVVSAPREKQIRQTVEVRPRDYRNDRGEIIGQGSEIVREIVVGKCCAVKAVS